MNKPLTRVLTAGVLTAALAACDSNKPEQVTGIENGDQPENPIVETPATEADTPTSDTNDTDNQAPVNDNSDNEDVATPSEPVIMPSDAFTGEVIETHGDFYNVVDGSRLESGQSYIASGNTHIINEVPNNTSVHVEGFFSWVEQNGHGKNFSATEGICFTNLGGLSNHVEVKNDGGSILGVNVSGNDHSLVVNGQSGIIQVSDTFSAVDTHAHADGDFQNIRFQNMTPEANGNHIDTHRFTSGNQGLGENTSFTNLEHLNIENGSLSSSAQFTYTDQNVHTLSITNDYNHIEVPINGRTYFTGHDICEETQLECTGMTGNEKDASLNSAPALTVYKP